MKNKIKNQILELRGQGKSYSQIQEQLKCSPGTISYHCSEGSKDRAKARSKIRDSKRDKFKCGHFKNKSDSSNICKRDGERIKKRDKILQAKISEYFKNYSSNTKHTSIRRLARVLIQDSNREKKCTVCGFDDYVELCHIKAIKDFSPDATIGEVNHENNLVYLCPNHHKLLDIGKIKL